MHLQAPQLPTEAAGTAVTVTAAAEDAELATALATTGPCDDDRETTRAAWEESQAASEEGGESRGDRGASSLDLAYEKMQACMGVSFVRSNAEEQLVYQAEMQRERQRQRKARQQQEQQEQQQQELERRVAEMALALERSRQELLRAQAELEPEPEPEPEPVAHQCAGCSLVVPRERFSDAQWAKRPQSRCRVCISSGVPVRAKLAPDTAPDTERKHSQREHSTMQDLLLALARENSELRYEDGADVPVSLDLSGDGSVELCVGGQPWQPRTANGADETESCIGLGVLQTGAMPDDSTTPYEMTPYDRAQASSGRGRRGEAARKEARRLEELEVQVTLAQKSKCVLCGHPPPVPGAPKPAAKMKMGGLPRFG